MNKNTYLIVILTILSFFSCGETPSPVEEPEDLSMYITDVFEYVYAPGQHAESAKPGDALKFIGKPVDFVHLGGFGGYIVAGFDHDVPNVEGAYDFEIYPFGVDSEPAVVYVMQDKNKNGLPDDDDWYELKGSEFNNENTIRNYELTYYKAQSDDSNITWTDNRGGAGELISSHNTATTSGWWWSETKGNTVKFTGTRLPDAYKKKTDDPENPDWIFIDNLFTWGYAENNRGTDYDKKNRSNRFDIGNAVGHNGEEVNLPDIRFIKIQTAILQQAGWFNEISAEVMGARDLHR